jgi:hypothetical protein
MISQIAQIDWNNIPIFFGIYGRKAGITIIDKARAIVLQIIKKITCGF